MCLLKRIFQIVPMMLVSLAAEGWVGAELKPLEKHKSDLAAEQSGTYYQLSDGERKELVWMVKAALSAYPDGEKPLGYRSFTREEWNACAKDCPDFVYTEDGYFNVGSGLRGRLMVHMVNEGRVVLSLCGCNFDDREEFAKDIKSCVAHYLTGAGKQHLQALNLMQGVLGGKPRSHLWIVGHSLGGSLTTYLALHLPESRTRVKCATFNGYGISPAIEVNEAKQGLVAKRLCNVYCDGDPVYNNKFMPVAARHFGPSYSLVGRGDWFEQHGLDNMVKLMIRNRTGWAGL